MTLVIRVAVEESGTPRLVLLPTAEPSAEQVLAVPERGLAEVLTLQSQRGGGSCPGDQRAYFFNTLAEYQCRECGRADAVDHRSAGEAGDRGV
ncbi:hypothetical protein ACIBMX_10445 [Streptomyces phaeochromogenes]|uniref:hypothetical protein n=1 Tax=Streptomyces phaeochromogenes TaxID=1923 RepID=UPI0033F23517